MEGYLGLFFSSLGAATVLPFSSEVVLLGLLAVDRYDVFYLWLAASTGNTLGAWVNWVLGRSCLSWQKRKWFPVKPKQLARAGRWFNRYGTWSLLLAWLPVVGDTLTFIAGVLRVNVWWFLALVAIGKSGRYAVVILIAQGLL